MHPDVLRTSGSNVIGPVKRLSDLSINRVGACVDEMDWLCCSSRDAACVQGSGLMCPMNQTGGIMVLVLEPALILAMGATAVDVQPASTKWTNGDVAHAMLCGIAVPGREPASIIACSSLRGKIQLVVISLFPARNILIVWCFGL